MARNRLSHWGIVTVMACLSVALLVVTPNTASASQRVVSIGFVGPARSAPGLPLYLFGSDLSGIRAINFDTKSIIWVYTGKVTEVGHDEDEVSLITPKLDAGSYKIQVVTSHGTSGTKAVTIVEDDTQHLGKPCVGEWVGYEVHGAGGKLIVCDAMKDSARWVAPAQWPSSSHPILTTPIRPKPEVAPTTTRTKVATTTTTTTTSTTTTTTTLAPTGPFPNATWAGYVVPNSTPVTSVSGTWTVPRLDCAVESGGSFNSWDGIGGYEPAEQLLQTGVEAYCEAGVQTTYAWWELIPPVGVVVPFDDFPVSPGDVVEASAYQANGAWVTRLDDLTTGISGWMITDQGYGVGADTSGGSFVSQGSLDLSFTGAHTAEWIVEDAGYTAASPVLANFGTVTFSDLATSISPFTLTPAEGLEVVQNGTTLMTPSPPTSSGFSVSYTG